ncbi:MAG: thioredoxin [Candidatus Tyloplasma litorale]|nr:MAG: thioredoxin [Mycoplasmatales bacterium]
MKKINLKELNDLISSGDKIFIKFGAEWCGQCKMSGLLIDKLEPLYTDIKFFEIDVDDNNLWDDKKLNITEVPTFLGFDNKKLKFNSPGYKIEDELVKLINQLK